MSGTPIFRLPAASLEEMRDRAVAGKARAADVVLLLAHAAGLESRLASALAYLGSVERSLSELADRVGASRIAFTANPTQEGSPAAGGGTLPRASDETTEGRQRSEGEGEEGGERRGP